MMGNDAGKEQDQAQNHWVTMEGEMREMDSHC